MKWQFLTNLGAKIQMHFEFLLLKIVNFETEIKIDHFSSFSRICSFWTKNGPLTHCESLLYSRKKTEQNHPAGKKPLLHRWHTSDIFLMMSTNLSSTLPSCSRNLFKFTLLSFCRENNATKSRAKIVQSG